MMGCIYQAKNLINGKCYIGKTVRKFKYRKKGHLYDTERGSTLCFHNALRKYGAENFQWSVLYEDVDAHKLLEMEAEFVKLLNSIRPNGYNICEGGQGSVGYHHTPEAREKISKASAGNTYCLGRKQTDDIKAQISATLTGIRRSEETKGKIRTYLTGRKRPEGHSQAMSRSWEVRRENGTATWTLSDQTKANMCVAAKLRCEVRKQNGTNKASDETKRKMSIGQTGKKRSEEAKENMRRAWDVRRLREKEKEDVKLRLVA